MYIVREDSITVDHSYLLYYTVHVTCANCPQAMLAWKMVSARSACSRSEESKRQFSVLIPRTVLPTEHEEKNTVLPTVHKKMAVLEQTNERGSSLLRSTV
jgi:hypothetical protein